MQTSQSTGFAWSRTSLSFVIGYHFLLLETSLSYHAMGKNSTRPKQFPSLGRKQVRVKGDGAAKNPGLPTCLFPHKRSPCAPPPLPLLRETRCAISGRVKKTLLRSVFSDRSPRGEHERAARRASPPRRGWRSKKSRSFDRDFFGAPSGTRTQDPLIKSQLLYQLS